MPLAERPCLITYECDVPLYRGYLAETRRRFHLLFPAYSAFGATDVRPLARETPVRFLVICREGLNSQCGPRLYPAPYGREIHQWFRRHMGQRNFWQSSTAPQAVYLDTRCLIFDLASFRESTVRSLASRGANGT